MKKFLCLAFLVLAAVLHADPVVLDLGSHGQITLYFPDGWKTNITSIAGDVTLTAAPANEDVNASFSMTVTAPEKDQFARKDKLKMQVEIAGAQYAESSTEGKAVAKPFNLQSGFGYH